MDKSKVKFILIVFAVVLAIVILYRLFSGVAESTVEKKKAQDKADAELYAQKIKDEYTGGREEETKAIETQKIEFLENATIAEGYNSLEEYLDSFPNDSIRNNYLSFRSEFIRVMGVDPGIIRYNDLEEWYRNYQSWKGYNAEYIRLTGESKSFLDPDFDTPQEMEAAVVSAEAAIEEAKRLQEEMWIDEYELFCNDREGLKGCPYISLSACKKWLDSPEQLLPLQEYLTEKYNMFVTQRVDKLNSAFNSLKSYFNGGYVRWKNSAKNFVRGANNLPDGTFKEVNAFNLNDFCYTAELLRKSGGVNIWSRVDSFNAPHDKLNYTNWLDASLAVANFNYSYEESINILGLILSSGISAAIQKNNKVRSYMPERLNNLMSRIEAAYYQHYTPFGETAERLESLTLPAYSQGVYKFSDDVWNKIESNKMTLQNYLNS